MEKQARHIELASRIYKEDFKNSWRICGFNLMPFQEDHPVYGPWFMLGKTRESQWSVLVTKELHDGIKNIGFRLVRGEESDTWDMVTFSLGLKFEDGRFLKCIDRQVVGKESDTYYKYLVKTIKAELKEHLNETCPAPIQRELYDHFKACRIREQSGISDLLNGKGGPCENLAWGILQESANMEYSAEESKTDPNVNPSPDDLFQQENITVVCEIEYTYMMPDPVPEKKETEKDNLFADFGHLFTSGKFSDITLKCGNFNLPCHKAVLYTQSLLFKEFLDKTPPSQQHLIVNVNFDLPTFKAVLLYMYANELDEEFSKSEDNCWKMYKAAGLFGVPGLRSFCLEVLEENDDCKVNDSRDMFDNLSVLSVDNSNQKLPVDVLAPVTNTSTQTLISN
ncbi:hypothetical protein JTE90_017102 [Oedothorax gibbosus]|uniref:BTB domain-containing protein n=1 Tax=Oedothorax gibbosus TaxID=931172 RepID=A0AAV6UF23_9ARAC|nr:hypothetical protein JTE90_017102 [Oedothorax gibbosus]